MLKKNIAFLGHGIYFGGATTSLYLMIKNLDGNIYNKYLYVPSIRSMVMKNDFRKYCKISLIKINQIRNAQTCKTSTTIFKKIIKIDLDYFIQDLIKNKIDILHINTSVFPHVHEQVKKYTNIKIITHVRELIPKYDDGSIQKYMINQILKFSDAIITISDNEAIPFLSHSKLFVIPNPFEFSNSNNNISYDFRKKYNIDDQIVLIGMLGQFSPSKGQLEFLKVLNDIIVYNKIQNPFKFIIAGVAKKPNKLYVNIKKLLGKKDYVDEFYNYINHNQLYKYLITLPYVYDIFPLLSSLDIVVRPALTEDPWGRDIIEAFAFGKPVIATGTSDFFVKNNVNGFLIYPFEISKIADKIVELILNSSLRKQFGCNGKKLVEEVCSIEKFIKEITQVYKTIGE